MSKRLNMLNPGVDRVVEQEVMGIPMQVVFAHRGLNGEPLESDAQLEGKFESEGRFGVSQLDYCETQMGLRHGKGSILALKNGNAFTDGGLNVESNDDGYMRNFLTLYVYANEGRVNDAINGYLDYDFYDYIEKLKALNPKLRCDMTLTYMEPWDEKSAEVFDWLAIRK